MGQLALQERHGSQVHITHNSWIHKLPVLGDVVQVTPKLHPYQAGANYTICSKMHLQLTKHFHRYVLNGLLMQEKSRKNKGAGQIKECHV